MNADRDVFLGIVGRSVAMDPGPDDARTKRLSSLSQTKL
jgi:hypothetical protein